MTYHWYKIKCVECGKVVELCEELHSNTDVAINKVCHACSLDLDYATYVQEDN